MSLSSLSANDREEFEASLDWCIRNDSLAFTLLGSKPVSIMDLPGQHPRLCSYPALPFSKLINILTRLQHFKAQNGKEENFALFKSKRGWATTFAFVNKDLVRKTVAENPAIFGRIELETLFADEEKFMEFFFSRNDITGILLGYGETNSRHFYLACNRGAIFLVPLPGYLDYDSYWLNKVRLPSFMTFKGGEEETKALKKQYAIEREEILKMMEKPDFMEIVFKRIMS